MKFKNLVLLLFVLFLFNTTFSTIILNYTINNNVIKKGSNLTINLVNVTAKNQNFKGKLKIYLDNDLKGEFNLNLSNSSFILTNFSTKINKFYSKVYFVVENNSFKLNKSKEIYVYDPIVQYCKVLDDKIIEKGKELKLKLKFKYNDDLKKKAYLYLDNKEENDYSFDDELNKIRNIIVDDLYSYVKCIVELRDINYKIFEQKLPILIYEIRNLKFKFDDKETLSVENDEFDLSNKDNEVEFKISLEGLDYVFNFKNKTNINDFDFNILENDDLKDKEDKINFITDLLEDLTDKDGIKLNYKIKIKLYNGSLLDEKTIEDDYYIKEYENTGSFEFDNNNNFDLDLIIYNESVEQYQPLDVKVKIKNLEDDEFSVKVCLAIDGNSYCKTVSLDDEDNKNKVLDFKENLNLEPGTYKACVYAYDEDYNVLKWECFNYEVKPAKVVKVFIENPLIVGFKGETKQLKVKIINPSTLNQNVILLLTCGNIKESKEVKLNKGETKEISFNVKITDDCDGKIEVKNSKLLEGLTEFSIITKQKEEKEDKNNVEVKKETELICKVDKDLVYSKNDNLSFYVISSKGANVTIKYNNEKIVVSPSSFVSSGKDLVKVLRKTDDLIIDNLKVVCSKDGKTKEKSVTIYFYEKKKSIFENNNLILYVSIGLTVFIALIVLLLLII